MLKLGKRGQERQLFVIFEIIASFTVVVLLFMIAQSFSKGFVLQKSIISKDIALSIDALNSVPGNALFFYGTGSYNFVYTIKNGKVVVSEFTNLLIDPTKRSYPYQPVYGREPDYVFNNPKLLVLGKAGNKFTISDSEIVNLNRFVCGSLAGPPGKTMVDSPDKDKPLNVLITKGIATRLSGGFLSDRLSQNKDLSNEEVIKSINDMELDTIISVDIGEDKSEGINNVKAYIPSGGVDEAESWLYACNILNSLSDKFVGITGTAIIPVIVSELGPEDPKVILGNAKHSVYLELGNIGSKDPNFPDDASKVATAILEGMSS